MKFSVIIPCYNMAGYIAGCIDSVLRQTFRSFEIIVVDDGSSDNSVEVACGKLRGFDDIYVKRNSGPADARNLAICNAAGEWIVPLDADDRLTPDALYEFALAINANPDATLIVPQVHRQGNGVDVVRKHKWRGYDQLLQQNFLPNSCCYRRDAAMAINGYRNGTMYEDWEFWIRLLYPEDRKVINIPKVLVEYTVRPDSRCHEADKHYQEECAKIRRMNPKIYDL